VENHQFAVSAGNERDVFSELGEFPRGLCAIGDRVYVGVSALR
jgi:hypothetical protein